MQSSSWAIKFQYAENQYECLEGADALIISTEWNEFRTPNFLKIVTALKNKVIFDGRIFLKQPRSRELGFHYESIGRAPARTFKIEAATK